MNAITLIKNDHRKVEALIARHQRTRDADARSTLFAEIKRNLDLHAQVEEEVFYPAVAKARTSAEPVVEEAYDEHQELKALLTTLAALPVRSERYKTNFQKMKSALAHHIEEEETRILPRARRDLSTTRLEALGREMQRRKESALTAVRALVSGTAATLASAVSSARRAAGRAVKTGSSRSRTPAASKARRPRSRSTSRTRSRRT
jgi:hemerythrin superfamily protein